MKHAQRLNKPTVNKTFLSMGLPAIATMPSTIDVKNRMRFNYDVYKFII